MRICDIEGCGRAHQGRGWCSLHYQAWRAHGDPLGRAPAPPEGEKRRYTPRAKAKRTCSWCSEEYESSAANSKFCNSKCREKDRYARQKESRLAWQREYRAREAEAIAARAKARHEINPERRRAQARESYLRHRDRRVADAIRYQRAHPEVVALTRTRRRTTERFSITQRDHRRMLERFRHRCAYCEVRLAPWGRELPNSLQWDHVIPLSRGGRDSVGNIVPSCRDCNIRKSAHLPIYFLLESND